MGIPNEIMNLMMNSSGDSDTYQITRSLRFKSASSTYLSRVIGSGSKQKFTWSFWTKITSYTSANEIIFNRPAGFGLPSLGLTLAADGTLNFFDMVSLTPSYNFRLITTQTLKDTTSWYHIVAAVDTTQSTAANRVRLYLNGTEITSFTTSTYPSINTNTSWGVTNDTNSIGVGNSSSKYINGYLAEIYIIDGQQLTPSSFGQTDLNGRWVPISYTGTYGTQGAYLNFSDNSNTTSTTLGKDYSGNGNNWTPNNFSVTAGVGNDSLTDSPSNYGTDTGLGGEVRGNYCMWNLLWQGRTNDPSNGNLDYPASSVGIGNFGLTTGKWYWEITSTGGTTTAALYTTSATTSTTITTGVTKGFRFDADAGTFDWTTNGSTWNSITTGLTSGPYYLYVSTAASTTASLNCGQRPFSYTAPAGYKAICTSNLPTPTIKKSSQFMNVVTYTGTGATRSLTGVGFIPDLVWTKSRSNIETHKLTDSVRGTSKALSSETTGDEVSESGVTSFDSDGFTIGSTTTGYNTNTYTYVGWSWKKGTTPGFDIVTYTGNGTNRTITHGLGSTPHFMIVKARTTAGTDQGWAVYHRNLTSATYYALLNTSAAEVSDSTVWNSTAPTSSVFSVGTNALVNTNNDTYLSYLWTEISGFSRFGTYTGNGAADGPFVWCGFRPKYIMIKYKGGTGDWLVYDSVRNAYNTSLNNLITDSTAVENTTGKDLDILSNGFKIRNTDTNYNTSSGINIFAAFAELPFKYSRGR